MRRDTWDLNHEPGIEPVPCVVEAPTLNHWAIRELPEYMFFVLILAFVWDSGLGVVTAWFTALQLNEITN